MNPVLPEQAQEALDAFGHTASWEQRARLLLQWGERLAPLAEHERQEEHRVHGCESLVWLLGEQRDGHWRFRADSDARLIRGLLAVLLAQVDGIETRERRAWTSTTGSPAWVFPANCRPRAATA